MLWAWLQTICYLAFECSSYPISLLLFITEKKRVRKKTNQEAKFTTQINESQWPDVHSDVFSVEIIKSTLSVLSVLWYPLKTYHSVMW